jgi:hypothetical protein
MALSRHRAKSGEYPLLRDKRTLRITLDVCLWPIAEVAILHQSITKSWGSLFRQTGLAQTIECGLQHRLTLDQPFDRKLGIDTTCFSQSGFCLIYFRL